MPISRQPLIFGVVLVGLTLANGCGSLPSLPGNPFGSAPTATPAPSPVAAPPTESTATAFTPFWVKNYQTTEMWSAPAGEAGAVSFGATSAQFCSFLVGRAQDNARLYVFNPYSGNYFWIDADAVGPVAPPERRSEPKPPNQNCTDAVYEG